jgi:transposase InsO family protein
MPWKEKTVMFQKLEFVQAAQTTDNFRLLCSQFGITPTTGYKYLMLYLLQGEEGLKERSRRPKNQPTKTCKNIEDLIVLLRKKYAWGGEKIRTYLVNKGFNQKSMPSEKTIDRILKRNGLITEEESQKHRGWIRFEHANPNDLWQMDFKGHFATEDARCNPLTILDDHSRFCITIKSCRDQSTDTVRSHLIGVFREYGLPKRMTMDNGSPWGYSGKQEHTTFTAWLIQLGIYVSHSRPGHPQTQGKLERFHRTLKLELLSRYKFKDLIEAQEGFDWWRDVYNTERPHAAIENERPMDRYKASERVYPEKMPSIEYDESFIVRKVQYGGFIHLKGAMYRVGDAFRGQPVGIKDGEDGLLDIYFGHQRINKIDPRYQYRR